GGGDLGAGCAAGAAGGARHPGGSGDGRQASAGALAAGLVLQGVVVTLDALFTERRVAQLLLDQGADYLLIAKHNQPTVREDIAYLFADTAAVAESFAVART